MGPADYQRKILFQQSHQHSYKYKIKWEPVNISQPSLIENRTGKYHQSATKYRWEQLFRISYIVYTKAGL